MRKINRITITLYGDNFEYVDIEPPNQEESIYEAFLDARIKKSLLALVRKIHESYGSEE